jgi:hypothetical protein
MRGGAVVVSWTPADHRPEPGNPGPGGARRGAYPLDFATAPDSLARSLFDATIKAHLDHLAHAQREDGGWMFNRPTWSPAAELEWRGFLTVAALRTCAPMPACNKAGCTR